MLQCRSKARTRPIILWLFRRLISTCELFFTLRMRMLSGPAPSDACSSAALSSGALLCAGADADMSGQAGNATETEIY